MENPRTLGSKNIYKILVISIKYIPISIAVLFIVGVMLNLFGVSSIIISYLCGTSVMSIVLLYLLSYVFRFCYLYRLPLHYIAFSNILVILNKIGVITSILILCRLLVIVLGIFIIIYVVYWYLNRNKPKHDL